MNNKKGFTLTELVVTIIVVGILAMVAVPSYRGYVNRGIATEGKALLGEVNAAQQIYYARHGKYYTTTKGQTSFSTDFGVNAKRNKYFTNASIDVNATGDSYTATTNNYKGKALTIKGTNTSTPVITDPLSGNSSI